MSNSSHTYSDLWLKSKARMMSFGQAETLTTPKWLVRLTGDHASAILLNQILYHTSRKPDGWFYKSYREWHEELLLTESQVRRSVKVIEALDLGLETKLKKVNGAPTLHYWIDPVKFEAIQERYLKSVISNLADSEAQNGFVEIEETDADETSETPPPLDTEEATVSVAIENPQENTDSPPTPPPGEAANAAESVPDLPIESSASLVETPKHRKTRTSPRPNGKAKDPLPDNPPTSKPRNLFFDTIAYFSFDVPWGTNPGKGESSRIGKVRKELKATFADTPLRAIDLYSAYQHNAELNQDTGINQPADPAKVVKMVRAWMAAGKPIYDPTQKDQPQDPWMAVYLSTPADERVPAPPLPVSTVDYRGYPIKRDSEVA